MSKLKRTGIRAVRATEGKSMVPAERIERAILLIRGEKVMLDRDLAQLYAVTTGNLNKGVSRNRARFPRDFMFRLTAAEFARLRFQFGRSKAGRGNGKARAGKGRA